MEKAEIYPISGSCQCGQVHYEITEPFLAQGVCHCIDCQKLSATSFSISAVLKTTSFRLISGALKKWSRLGESGATIECYFCPECGNRIYHKKLDEPDLVRLKPGTLHNTDVINPTTHVWVSRKQSWVTIPDGVKKYDRQT